jgi:hypothetical protein
VGVGVGVPLGLLLVVSWVLFFLHRRKQAAQVAVATDSDKVRPIEYAEAVGSSPPRGELPADLPGGELYGEPRY